MMAGNGTRLSNNLATNDACTVDTTKQNADVVAGFSLIQQLVEHFDTCSDGCHLVILNAEDFDRIHNLQSTSLNTACCNSTTSGDSEDVFNRHKERLICITNRFRNPFIDSAEKLHNLVAPFAIRILKSLQSRATDNRCFLIEAVLDKKLCDFHLDKLKKLIIINHVALIKENDHTRNTDLAGKKHVLLGLSHNAVCSRNNEDRTVHLSSARDHVLDIVSVAWAVNVRIVSLLSLILNMSCIDRNTTLSLFRSLVDVAKFNENVARARNSLAENCSDRCSQSCFAVVDMSDGADVYMRFGSLEFLLTHFCISSLKSAYYQAQILFLHETARSYYISIMQHLQDISYS